ncbi:hypothetical protein Goarm_022890, partial [Gossypium armourianum]|nr:hypothetical protein [Gossypium armourianum]
ARAKIGYYIGDGTSILVWNVAWLPDNKPYIIQSPRVNEIVMVVDLINSQTRLRWCLERFGDYTVHSGYRLLLRGFPGSDSDSYRDIEPERQTFWDIRMNEATLVDWLCHLYYENTHQRSLITITIWALWLSRNKLVYEGSRQTVNELSPFVLGCVKELEMIEKTYPKASQDQLVRWTPPKTRWAKANFDEGFCSDLHKSSTKVVIQDENGLLMGVYCSWNRNIRSPEATEALAAVQAVRFAQDMGFRRVTFEGDSIVVISKIEAQHLDRSEVSIYIWEAK